MTYKTKENHNFSKRSESKKYVDTKTHMVIEIVLKMGTGLWHSFSGMIILPEPSVSSNRP